PGRGVAGVRRRPPAGAVLCGRPSLRLPPSPSSRARCAGGCGAPRLLRCLHPTHVRQTDSCACHVAVTPGRARPDSSRQRIGGPPASPCGCDGGVPAILPCPRRKVTGRSGEGLAVRGRPDPFRAPAGARGPSPGPGRAPGTARGAGPAAPSGRGPGPPPGGAAGVRSAAGHPPHDVRVVLEPGGDGRLLLALTAVLDLLRQRAELVLTHREALDPLRELRVLLGELLARDGVDGVARAPGPLRVLQLGQLVLAVGPVRRDRKSTRLNSSH